MKHYTYLIILFVTCFLFFQVLNFLELPYWMVVFSLPIYLYLSLFSSNKYNFRNSLNMERLPTKGYANRLKRLQLNSQLFANLGFRKFDEFYLPLTNDVLTFVYYHEKYPIILCDYHLGKIKCLDFMSAFENDCTLTTSNSENSGLLPREEEKMLQIFPGRTAQELLRQHINSVQFLEHNQLHSIPLELNSFRGKFMDSYRRDGEVINNLLGPIKVMKWMLSNHKQKYLRSVNEQFLAKTQKLPYKN